MIPTGVIEEIERQIDETRHALNRTLRALQLELSPRHQIEAALHSAKVRTSRSLRAGANWAVANPIPMTMAAIVLVATAVSAVTIRRRRG